MSAWVTTNLGLVATLQRGFDLPTRLRHSGTVPIVSSSGVSGSHNRAMVEAPGVVTGRYGTIGEVFYQETDFWPLNTTLWVSNFHGNNERFVYYLLQTIDFAIHSGKSGVPGVNRNDLHLETVYIPTSKDEQRRIANVLSDTDSMVDSLERLIAKKQAIKTGMMQQLLTGNMRMPGFNMPWKTITLGSHVNYVKNIALSRAQLDELSKVKYLHYGDIHTTKKSKIDPSVQDMPRAKAELLGTAQFLAKGDLVFADASEDPAGVGKSVEILSVPNNGVVSGLHTITARFDKSILADGFKAYLQFIPAFRAQLLRLAAGTKVLATNRSHISGIELDLPVIEEQQAIAQILDDADQEISALESRLEKAKAIKQGMMQELLSGKTRLVSEGAAP